MKEEWKNVQWVWWRGRKRGMETGKLWIGAWIRENVCEREGNSWKTGEKE